MRRSGTGHGLFRIRKSDRGVPVPMEIAKGTDIFYDGAVVSVCGLLGWENQREKTVCGAAAVNAEREFLICRHVNALALTYEKPYGKMRKNRKERTIWAGKIRSFVRSKAMSGRHMGKVRSFSGKINYNITPKRHLPFSDLLIWKGSIFYVQYQKTNP